MHDNEAIQGRQLNQGGAPYSRACFISSLAGRLAALPAPLPCMGVVSVVLPGLTDFHSTYGESAAEQLRERVYTAVKRFVPGTIIGRLTDAQFVMTYEFDPDWTDIEDVASDLRAVIANAAGRHDLALGILPTLAASIHCGSSHKGRALDLATEMLRQTNLAAEMASSDDRRGFVMYSPAEDERVRKGILLDRSLRKAIARQEFRLFYQPIVDLRTFEVAGLEGLIRWECPSKGLLTPDEFIPAAENSGLIVQLGAAMIDIAVQQVEDWSAAGWRPPWVSVNVVNAQLLDESFRATIIRAVTRGHVKPENLELELTERTFITWSNSTRRLLEEFREMGIGVALDDFGTGYSSLQYLRDMPVSKLKIDRAFIRRIATEPRDAAVAKVFIEIARTLELEIVAEGIEERAQAEMLLDYGCTLGQGFFFSRPQPASDIPTIAGRLRQLNQEAPLISSLQTLPGPEGGASTSALDFKPASDADAGGRGF